MKDPYTEGLANRSGPESCVRVGNCAGEALTGVHVGQVLSREIPKLWGADALDRSGRQHRRYRCGKVSPGSTRSETLCMHASSSHGNREIQRLATGSNRSVVRMGNSKEATL